MAVAQPLTMGDYYKQTDEGQVFRGFVPANPANFDIKSFVLSGLRENLFDRNMIRDPWAHLARFYETTSMLKPIDAEDQVKLRLFGFLLMSERLVALPSEQKNPDLAGIGG